MSTLGQMILKHAEANRGNTERTTEAGQRFAEAYLRSQEKLAAMSDEEWHSFSDAVSIGRQKAAAEAPALLVLEKHGELQIPDSSACEADDEEVAVFSAAAAEKLAESVDVEELAQAEVQEAIVHIAVDLAQQAATAGMLPVPPPPKQDSKKDKDENGEKDDDGNGKDEKKSQKKDDGGKQKDDEE